MDKIGDAARQRNKREKAAVEAFLIDATSTCSQRAMDVMLEFTNGVTPGEEREASHAGHFAGDPWRQLEGKLRDLLKEVRRG